MPYKLRNIEVANRPTKHSLKEAVRYLIQEAERNGHVHEKAVLEKALNCFELNEELHAEELTQPQWDNMLTVLRSFSRCNNEQIREFLYVLDILGTEFEKKYLC